MVVDSATCGMAPAVIVVAPGGSPSAKARFWSLTLLKNWTPAVVRETRLGASRKFAAAFPSAVYWKKLVRLSCLKPVLRVEKLTH